MNTKGSELHISETFATGHQDLQKAKTSLWKSKASVATSNSHLAETRHQRFETLTKIGALPLFQNVQ